MNDDIGSPSIVSMQTLLTDVLTDDVLIELSLLGLLSLEVELGLVLDDSWQASPPALRISYCRSYVAKVM